ncbi:MAG: hypothetical protein IPQ07_16235 [Myxococcales bacterium]|nr:hypothetical protein [Myxococcales bacterium]
MALTPRPFPPAAPHGPLVEVFPDLFLVTGTMKLPGVMPVRFSRNMTVVREGERLVLVNTVRLDEAGLAALDKLGKVTDVVRIAGNHGMDDPFYADRYGAKVWVVKGQRYTAGFGTASPDVYFEPTGEMVAGSAGLPIAGAKLFVIDSNPPEGLLLLPGHGGVLISGDCLQHWAKPDEFFSPLAKIMMRLMGFVKPHNIGPGWVKNCKPPKPQLGALAAETYANVLPAHGTAVVGNASSLYKPALERASR